MIYPISREYASASPSGEIDTVGPRSCSHSYEQLCEGVRTPIGGSVGGALQPRRAGEGERGRDADSHFESLHEIDTYCSCPSLGRIALSYRERVTPRPQTDAQFLSAAVGNRTVTQVRPELAAKKCNSFLQGLGAKADLLVVRRDLSHPQFTRLCSGRRPLSDNGTSASGKRRDE